MEQADALFETSQSLSDTGYRLLSRIVRRRGDRKEIVMRLIRDIITVIVESRRRRHLNLCKGKGISGIKPSGLSDD